MTLGLFEPAPPESKGFTLIERPGYFGRKKPEIIASYNARFGEGQWTLVWVAGHDHYEFEDACKCFYEESYLDYFEENPAIREWVQAYSEVIDNAPTNVQCGLDYLKQEAFSTHIQDITVRRVMQRLGLKFTGRIKGDPLVIRGPRSPGAILSPGVVPSLYESYISQPSLAPWWAEKGSVEDFWQSNKWVATRK